MWHVPVFLNGFAIPINYPSICPLFPERGKAFCKQHCSDACNGGIPTGLHEFLQFCGVKGRNGESGNFANMNLQRFQPCQPKLVRQSQIVQSVIDSSGTVVPY